MQRNPMSADANKLLSVAPTLGLTDQQAAQRLSQDGCNELPSTRPRSVFLIAFSILREPMFMLLVACGAIYLLLGNTQEALMLLGFVMVVMGITFMQERKAERALEALRDLSSPRALVIRNGVQKRIPGREIVQGDIVVLVEGDRVPADAVLLEANNLTIDEALLTGESIPVRKSAAENPLQHLQVAAVPGGDDLPFVFSGTLVVQGKGLAQVVSTGSKTAFGRVGTALAATPLEITHLQQEAGQVVRRLAWLGFALAAVVAVWYGAARHDWLNGFLAGITLAMALLPEELPVILTIFLGLGAWRLAQKNVLTRHIPAIEALGAATILCVDKTGTLTQNKMALAQICVQGELYQALQASAPDNFPEHFHETLEFAVLASHRDPFDPTEIAIRNAGHHLLARTEHLHGSWQLMAEYPLSKELLAMSRVWRAPDRAHYVIAAKGAPEAVIDLCHLDIATAQKILEQTNLLAQQGLRVLGVAKATFTGASEHQELPEIQHDFVFHFLGLVALADPVRPNVPHAIRESHAAGLRVIMLTGDYPATAINIARQIGLEAHQQPSHQVMTGSELETLNDHALKEAIQSVNVFCRVTPEHKLRLVKAFKANGDIVAMTGDGVNDAPALKAAHIGIAMGARGTDVARESAALVLLDDDFSSIVAAVKLGRRIFDNLRKAIVFILAVHIPIVGLSLVPVMLGWPVILMPIHILFLQLIIDPVCSVVFEAEPEDISIMKRPPRKQGSKLFDREILQRGILQGLLLAAALLAIFYSALHWNLGANEARALTFTTLVMASLALILANRSWSKFTWRALSTPNTALWSIVAATLTMLTLVLFLPTLSNAFYFSKLHLLDVLWCLLASLILFFLFELVKRRRIDSGD